MGLLPLRFNTTSASNGDTRPTTLSIPPSVLDDDDLVFTGVNCAPVLEDPFLRNEGESDVWTTEDQLEIAGVTSKVRCQQESSILSRFTMEGGLVQTLSQKQIVYWYK